VNAWLERRTGSIRWPLRFLYVMVEGGAWLAYVPAAGAFFVASWENGRLLWRLALNGPAWLDLVEVGVPVAQTVTALVLIGLLVVAGIRVGWEEQARAAQQAVRH
jgi:hypothetical protein